jgi:hypothetical protein
MRKLILTCECGERMKVPRSAIGRTGVCPSCGRRIAISADNSRPAATGEDTAPHAPSGSSRFGNAREEAKRRYAQAVDLYLSRRYAEALAIFSALTQQFPDDADIERSRIQCIQALRDPIALAIEHKPGGPVITERADAEMDEETIKKFIMEKMLYGSNEMVQLRAAELASRILGLIPGDTGPERSDHVDESQRPDLDSAPRERLKSATPFRGIIDA